MATASAPTASHTFCVPEPLPDDPVPVAGKTTDSGVGRGVTTIGNTVLTGVRVAVGVGVLVLVGVGVSRLCGSVGVAVGVDVLVGVGVAVFVGVGVAVFVGVGVAVFVGVGVAVFVGVGVAVFVGVGVAVFVGVGVGVFVGVGVGVNVFVGVGVGVNVFVGVGVGVNVFVGVGVGVNVFVGVGVAVDVTVGVGVAGASGTSIGTSWFPWLGISMCTCRDAPLQKAEPSCGGDCTFQKPVTDMCACQYTHIDWPAGTVNVPLVGNVKACVAGGFARPTPGGVQPTGANAMAVPAGVQLLKSALGSCTQEPKTMFLISSKPIALAWLSK
jgi:hypothetical protein